MLFVLLSVGVVLLTLPGLARPLGRRVAPSEWAHLCAVSLAGGAAVVELTLVLYAAPTVFRAVCAPLLASLCERMLGPLVPGGAAAGWAAAVVAAAVAAAAAAGVRQAVDERRTLRCERCVGEHRDHGGYELVVLPTAALVAVSVPDMPRGQVVVSEGLVAALAGDELDAVLRHEAAHLDHGHDRYLLLATALEHSVSFLPPVRHSTAALRVTLERWADEEAAGPAPESRRVVRDALLGVTSAMMAAPSVAAFASAETLLERITALEGEAPQPSRLAHGLLYIPGTVLATVAAYAFLAWGADMQRVVAMAGSCYM